MYASIGFFLLRMEEAIEVYKQGLHIEPDNADIHYNVSLNKNLASFIWGARCSSVVRALWCDGSSDNSSWWIHWAISRSSQCSMTGVQRPWYVLSCGMMHIKEPLLMIGKSSPCVGSRFPLAIWVVLYHMSDTI